MKLKLQKLYVSIKEEKNLAKLLSGSASVFVFQILGLFASYLFQVFLGRWMGPAGLGSFNFAFTWGRLLAVAGDFGFSLSALKFIPDYFTTNKFSKLKGVLLSFSILSVVGCIVLAMGSILYYTKFPPSTDIAIFTLFIGLALAPLIALKELFMQALRAMDYIWWSYVPAHVGQHVIALAAAAYIFFSTGSLTSQQAISTVGFSLIVIIVIQILGLYCSLNKQLKNVKPEYDFREWFSKSIPMIIIKGFVTLMDRIDILMVGILLGSYSTGIYSVAARMATLTGFALFAVNAIIAPRISPLYNSGKLDELQKLVRQATILSFLASLGLFVAVLVMSPFLLSLFGSEFIQGRTTLALLSLSHLVNSGLGPVGYLMHLTGYQMESTRIHVVALIVNVILNLIFVPLLGINGAAIATTVAVIFQNIWMYFTVRRLMGINTIPLT